MSESYVFSSYRITKVTGSLTPVLESGSRDARGDQRWNTVKCDEWITHAIWDAATKARKVDA